MKYELAESSWGPEEIQAIQRVIDSDRYTMGDNVARFEKAFAEKFGMRYGLMVSSGSTANLVGVASLFYKKNRPLQRGDEVIVPSISWATTFYPLMQYGLKLRFLDVELDTLNMDVSKLEEALTPRTRMVVAVSILGNPCALDTMRAFCDKHDLILFEDNCESMGAELNGKACGTFGEVCTFSTFFSHHISTMEGGVILTDDEEIYHLARSLRAHGWTRDLPPDSQIFDRTEDDFFEAYRFILPGYNARPLELSGAVGLEQLPKLDAMVDARRRNGDHFVRLFGKDDRFIIQKENGLSSWFAFTLILNPELSIQRKDITAGLRDADIGFRIITGGNFLRHDVIKYFDYDCVGEIKNADIAHDRGFFVGNFPRDISSELNYFHRVINQLLS
ncbi:MAG: DegT/DnrJ/EryC1/StrS family aminotransferase [Candidatus Nitrohelix vancouverensis]|uniref:DegT/DnrJ/EryC1/StrS family aminotransferase n=1 Tax=Candidatus Nitrohelix vancouverensis TaxID=2705534 RepID=A0A7T0C5F5_9BACT|nr:MAG: DegT/DnrJ/EryC1/StrS family aminotransferase [Candidatus Nitrohelix vancouverensis]